MKRETVRHVRELSYYSSIGLQVALSILIGYFGGQYLDHHVFSTTPWLTYIGLALGIAAGFRNILLAIRRIERLDWKNRT